MAEKFVIPIHGQDHCPGGPDPISCLPLPYVFRAAQWVTGTTTGTGSDLALAQFDKFDDITGPVFGGNLSAGKLLSIEGLLEGLYVVTMNWYWDGSFNATHGAEIENNLGVGITEPNMVEMPRAMAGHGGGDVVYSFTIIQRYPRLYDELNLATPARPLPDYSFWVGQTSGATKNAYVSAEVAYWGVAGP